MAGLADLEAKWESIMKSQINKPQRIITLLRTSHVSLFGFKYLYKYLPNVLARTNWAWTQYLLPKIHMCPYTPTAGREFVPLKGDWSGLLNWPTLSYKAVGSPFVLVFSMFYNAISALSPQIQRISIVSPRPLAILCSNRLCSAHVHCICLQRTTCQRKKRWQVSDGNVRAICQYKETKQLG